MADLNTAKADVLKQFQSSLPPGLPTPIQFTIPEMLTRPILSTGVLNHGAHNVIAGTFVPATDTKLDSWSTADQFETTYLNMVQNMAYGLSIADQNQVTKLKTDNDVVLNKLVTIWEQTFAPITQAQMTAANVFSKIDYVTAQFTDSFMKSLNWAKFAPDYNQAKAAIDILSNINSAAVQFGQQITGIKNNIATPGQSNGGLQAFDANNNKVWFPGYNVDPNFPSKFQNGQTVKIVIELTDIGTSSSSFSINGSAGGGFNIGFLRIGGSTSVEYNESHFKSLMSKVRIELEFDNVCFLTSSPANLTANNTIGWYQPQILKQAYEHNTDSSGPYFASQEADLKAILAAGGLQSLRGLLVSTMPKGKMSFASDDFASFQKYFHTETHASASLFGFIPLASVNTSFTKASSGSSEQGYAMDVAINPAGDKNNLVVHGAVLENPLD